MVIFAISIPMSGMAFATDADVTVDKRSWREVFRR